MEITPKEKAKDLFSSFKVLLIMSNTDAGEEVQCSLLANRFALKCCTEVLGCKVSDSDRAFWSEVEQELLKFYK
jgi:hypothetical protein